MSQEGASDELIKQYLGISERTMRPFSFLFLFTFFSYFISQKYIVSLGKFVDGGFRNPALLLTILGWPLVLKTAVKEKEEDGFRLTYQTAESVLS